MGLELELFFLKALFLECLHFLYICDLFNPLFPQGMDIETLLRAGKQVYN